MKTQILPTKLHLPRVAEDLVHLSRAHEVLEQGCRRPLLLVSAPAGYGKSTLVSSWLTSRDEPKAWLSLDDAESDLRLFVAYFVAAVRSLFPESCAVTLEMVDAPELPSVSELAETLAAELDEIGTDFYLVLDDYHHIHGAAVHDLLSELMAHPPEPLRLVVVTRHDPPLPLATLRAHGELIEIRTEHLRFNRSEAGTLIRRQADIELDDAALDDLETAVEGWVVGLRLVALALRSQDDPVRFLSEMRGGLPDMHEYLIPEVLATQPPGLRDWLVQTSVLDRFCAPLCDALCDADAGSSASNIDGAAFLERIGRGGLFAVPLDARHEWYRYHHVFQELLRKELERSRGPEEVAALHRRASVWLNDHDLIEEAVEHALAAGDSELAGDVVAARRHELIDQEGYHRLMRLLDMLSAETIASNVKLLVAKAWACHYVMRLEESQSFQERARARCAAIPPKERKALSAEINALEILDLYLAGHAESVIQAAERTLRDLPSDASCMRGFVVAATAWAHQASGDSPRAVEFVSQELERHRPLGPAYHTRALIGLTIVHFRDGALHDVLPLARRSLEIAREHGLVESRVFGRAFLGWSHYLRNELGAAEPYLQAVLRDRALARRTWFTHCAFALALSYEAQNRAEDARRLARSVTQYAVELELPAVLEEARGFQAELALRHGHIGEALDWSRTFQADRPITTPYFYLPHLTLAKTQLARGTSESRRKAAATLRSVEDRLLAAHDRRRRADVLALQALCHEAQGERTEAFQKLNEALAMTEAGGAVRPFADLGPAMASLLKQLPNPAAGEPHMQRIFDAFEVSTSTPTARALEQALTNREQDVLELLAKRLRDKEIAQELVVSTATVKSHLKGLYHKLGVHGRREAVFKARDLGLLGGD